MDRAPVYYYYRDIYHEGTKLVMIWSIDQMDFAKNQMDLSLLIEAHRQVYIYGSTYSKELKSCVCMNKLILRCSISLHFIWVFFQFVNLHDTSLFSYKYVKTNEKQICEPAWMSVSEKSQTFHLCVWINLIHPSYQFIYCA